MMKDKVIKAIFNKILEHCRQGVPQSYKDRVSMVQALLNLTYPDKPCRGCGGSGRIFRLPVTALGETSNEFPCPNCKGKGVIPGRKMLVILPEEN